MRINEITYAYDIQSLKQHLDISTATKIGTVELLDVYHMDLGNGNCYFLYNPATKEYLSYVATDHNVTDKFLHLRQIENISGEKGAISTLMFFLTRKKNFKFVIEKSEPITSSGLNWVIRTIASGRKLFIFTNNNGQPLDIDALKKEWEESRIDPEYEGKISILIESINSTGYDMLFEYTITGLLLPMYKIFKDKDLD
jgi:hypothetical protein